MSARHTRWHDQFSCGLLCLLPSCSLRRHADDCRPGLWRVDASMGANAMHFLGIEHPPSAAAVVDDFGTLVRVP